MKQVNVRQLHANTGSIVDLAAKGRVVIVVKRGRPIAELRPIGDAGQRRALPDRTALLRRYPTLRADSGRFLEQDRS
jgi:prevent-host-death family protein